MQMRGNAHLSEVFPNPDYIKSATIIPYFIKGFSIRMPATFRPAFRSSERRREAHDRDEKKKRFVKTISERWNGKMGAPPMPIH
jgi:hypothetical protein